MCRLFIGSANSFPYKDFATDLKEEKVLYIQIINISRISTIQIYLIRFTILILRKIGPKKLYQVIINYFN